MRVLIGVILVGAIVITTFQESLIFLPQSLPKDYKFQFNLQFDEHFIEVESGVKLSCLLFKNPNPKGVVVYFHGNAGSLEGWGYVAEDFVPLGYDVLVVDYRGYGKSDGKISGEQSLYKDSDKVYEFVKGMYSEDQIIVYGRSIGTAIASRLAANNSPRMLVLETPYYDLPSLVKNIYPIVPGFIVKYKLPNYEFLQKAKVPIHLVHGTNDEIIPLEASEKLAALKPEISLTVIEGGGHNNLSSFPTFHEFLKSVL